jgi:hypothetical protein
MTLIAEIPASRIELSWKNCFRTSNRRHTIKMGIVYSMIDLSEENKEPLTINNLIQFYRTFAMVQFSLFIKYMPSNAKRFYDNEKKKK